MPPHRPPLTEYQRWNLAGACLANATDLLRDSRTLLGAGATTRAAFVLLASLEEMLRARYCLRQPTGTWREWWTVFRNHEAKFEEARRLSPELPEDMARTLLDLRVRSLYVDTDSSGDPLTRRGLVDPGGLDPNVLAGWSNWVQSEIGRTLSEMPPDPRAS
jgi:hypothetical protein